MIKRNKILYVVSTLKKSGPVNQLSYIIKYLDKNKFEPMVLTLSSEDKEDSMKNYFEDILNVKVNTLGLSRIKGIFKAKSKVKQFIKENIINLVHSQGIRADEIMSSINMPRVATLRNYPYYDYPMTYGKFKGFLMAKKHLKYLEKINKPVVVSKSISIMLKEKNSYSIDYVRNGTDLERFQGLDKTKLRKKFDISSDIILFVSVGHLSKRKDPLLVIKAFKDAEIKNSKLIFLGDGHLKEECLEITRNDSNIVLVGKVDNVHEYLGMSDYLISASHAEGLPNTVLEAMACGLPCVLSDISPHIEINELSNESSILFKTKNGKELSTKLQQIITKKYELMSRASSEIIKNNLSANLMSMQYQEIYLSLLDSNNISSKVK
jgi:glycosyltransferase involved in cell wall biosynthesis